MDLPLPFAPITALSGGERNRLLLAKLFAQPANLLVMDEPTNDLDVETLELLEEILTDYTGTLILVSHDREFLDNVVTQVWGFDGNGNVDEVVGGYSDYMRQFAMRREEQQAERPKAKDESKSVEAPKKKLSYKDQRELDELPARIDHLETEIANLTEQMSHPDTFADAQRAMEISDRLSSLQSDLDHAYSRWSELE